jgi:hypothetical protein
VTPKEIFHELIANVGESLGVATIMDVSEQQQAMPRHILLNSTPPVSISRVDHDYLRHKGVLSLLDDASCKELLRAYFHHVHPILPVFNLVNLPAIESLTASPSSDMLLFWAMAVAAVNVRSSSVSRPFTQLMYQVRSRRCVEEGGIHIAKADEGCNVHSRKGKNSLVVIHSVISAVLKTTNS